MGCHYLLQGIFLTQGLHCRWVFYPLGSNLMGASSGKREPGKNSLDGDMAEHNYRWFQIVTYKFEHFHCCRMLPCVTMSQHIIHSTAYTDLFLVWGYYEHSNACLQKKGGLLRRRDQRLQGLPTGLVGDLDPQQSSSQSI